LFSSKALLKYEADCVPAYHRGLAWQSLDDQEDQMCAMLEVMNGQISPAAAVLTPPRGGAATIPPQEIIPGSISRFAQAEQAPSSHALPVLSFTLPG